MGGALDFDDHIQSAKLPKPGTRKQLEDLVADLHSERLDRKKPLWQFTIIEGIEGRQAALYSKVHPAAVDGGAGMVITQAHYGVTDGPRTVAPADPKPHTRNPTQAERAILTMNDVMANALRQQINLISSVPKVMGQLTDMIMPVLSGKVGLPQIFAPRTPFNVTVEARRSYAALSISLFEAGNTDINNQVFGMNVPLATNYGDPLKRLSKIKQESGASKTMAAGIKDAAPSAGALGASMPASWARSCRIGCAR